MRELSKTATTGGIFHAFKSSLWIATVLIVRVSCIIEAQAYAYPSNTNSAELKTDPVISSTGNPQFDLSSSSSSHSDDEDNYVLNKSSKNQKNLKYLHHHQQEQRYLSSKGFTDNSKEIIQSTEVIEIDEDSCTGKRDGYYPNLSSRCSSYYFCAAGYQISYVCSPNTYFNGEKCISDYKKCPTTTNASNNINPCLNLSNGYYPMNHNPQKYFYCYHKAKVIELSCPDGKVYHKNTKSCLLKTTAAEFSDNLANNENEVDCINKANGFYIILSSNCKKYFYCIKGEKTVLECNTDYVFNGSLCVLRSRFNCPSSINNS